MLLHAAETWALPQSLTNMLQCCDRWMLRRVCGVSLADRASGSDILESCKLKDMQVVLKNGDFPGLDM